MARAGDGKPRSNKRRASRQLYKRVTEAQFDAFNARARDAGYPDAPSYLGAFVLAGVDLDTTTRREIIRILGQLGKIGSNINQIAKAANEGRIRYLDEETADTLARMRAEVVALGEDLREKLRR